MMLSIDKFFKDRRKVSLVCLTDVNDVTRLSVKHLTFLK
jgi:hypothetical protein